MEEHMKKEENIKTNKKAPIEKKNINNKEIIITVIVLVGAIVLGITLGKELFDAFRARMGI